MTPARDARWCLVAPRPTAVICIRHVGPAATLRRTWTSLTAYVFERGLNGPGTRAVGVAYDDPAARPADRVRYDACLTVEHLDAAALDLTDREALLLGIRFDVIMDEPLLCSASSAGPPDISAPWPDPAPGRPAFEQSPPVYEVYPRSPAFLHDGCVPAEYYVALRPRRAPAAPAAARGRRRPRPAAARSGARGGGRTR